MVINNLTKIVKPRGFFVMIYAVIYLFFCKNILAVYGHKKYVNCFINIPPYNAVNKKYINSKIPLREIFPTCVDARR